MRLRFRVVMLIVFLAVFAGSSFAQDYRATVQGTVKDSSEAMVNGAQLTLSNVNTGVSTTRKSDETGQYRIGFVEPGTYRITVTMSGFATVHSEGLQVLAQGDVTADFVLKPGALTESVTVTASPVEIQFNTTTKDVTFTSQQIANLPIQQRSPFSLAFLDPAVQNIYPASATPFHMWQATQMDFGGQTSRQNDVIIDGSPVQIGPKGSYTPTMDGTQEMVVAQVAVDAEYGHSAGGVITIATRSGTNDFHGTAYYFGRNPALNAASNSLTHTPSVERNSIWGGTLGAPILKNRLFNFAAYEGWKTSSPFSVVETLPTDAERGGDFSSSLNIGGTQRTIYNPYTTQYNPSTGVATRTPFPNNVIPSSMLDPTAAKMMADIWKPNTTSSNVAGANNFRKTVGLNTDYWNFSDRVDWNFSDRLKVFGRYSQFNANNGLPDFTGISSPAMPNGQGGVMASRNATADAVYTINPTTVADFRFGYSSFRDTAGAPQNLIGQSGLAQLWPGNAWYAPYANQYGANVYFPSITVGSNSFGVGSLYFQEPESYTATAKLAKMWGRHNLKAGLETRYESASLSYPGMINFSFAPATTSSTFINPPVTVSGDAYATMLLGAPNDGSSAAYVAPGQISLHYYGAYVQDDFRLSRRLTLNLGLRCEYESAPVDAQNRYTRYLNLTAANPVLQANPPVYPADVLALRQQYMGSGAPAPNGQWLFADSSHRNQFSAPGMNLAPRVGVAFRLNDKTAILGGWGRFLGLNSTVGDGLLVRPNFVGYSVSTAILPSAAGVPATALSNPFPSTNPLQPVLGNALGVNTNLGNGYGNPWGSGFRYQDYKDGTLNRFNLTVERELPAKFRLDVSFVATLARNLDSNAWWDSFPINDPSPDLLYNSLKGQLYAQVANPFYHYLTPAQFPGSLRNRATVPLYQLMRPYPQYGALYEASVPVEGDTVHNFEIRAQRAYSNGLTFMGSYLYNWEQSTYWPSDGDFTDGLYYYSRKPMWTRGFYPRHRSVLSGSYELPFGRGRQYMSNANRAEDAFLGGWSLSSIVTINSGGSLNFNGGNPFVTTGDPTQNVPAGYAFNPNVFQNPPDFTAFNGPATFPGVYGSMFWNIDASMSKSFQIWERLRLQFRLEAYNLTNSIQWSAPDSSFGDSTFGQLYQQQANSGRTVQYSLRLTF